MKNIEKTGELNTILGKGTYLKGELKVEHSLRVDGRVDGDIKTTDTLVVGKAGEISGNIQVKHLIVGGKMNGTVVALGKVVLESKSEFHGELKTSKLVIDEDAIFDGKCSMNSEEKGIQEDIKAPKFTLGDSTSEGQSV